LYHRGMRILTLTWNNRVGVPWATAHNHPNAATQGLTDFGKSVIRIMDSLGIIIDVSHAGPKTIDDVIATTVNPIIASHSNARTLRNNSRNLTDAQIQAIASRNGVIGINFYPPFLGSETPTIDTVIKHIDYIRQLVGVDFIALGSDFDGIEITPVGLQDVTRLPALTEALLLRGYSREVLRKILGENFLRLFRSITRKD
jgi:membrane dipeptidase